MREAITAIWQSVILCLTTFNKAISTVDAYVGWAEAEALAFANEETALRTIRLAALTKQAKSDAK